MSFIVYILALQAMQKCSWLTREGIDGNSTSTCQNRHIRMCVYTYTGSYKVVTCSVLRQERMSFSALSQRAVRTDRLALMLSDRQTSRSRWTSRDWSVAVNTSSMASCLSSLRAGTYLGWRGVVGKGRREDWRWWTTVSMSSAER